MGLSRWALHLKDSAAPIDPREWCSQAAALDLSLHSSAQWPYQANLTPVPCYFGDCSFVVFGIRVCDFSNFILVLLSEK